MQLIDEAEYDDIRSTITPYELGQLKCIDECGRRHVSWVGGDYDSVLDAIDVEACPTSLLGLELGDYFTAVVERRMRSGELIRILFCQCVDSPMHSAETRASFWAEVKAARSIDEHE